MGGSKSSGGGAGPMLEYGDKALKLQKDIYDQTRQDSMPWLQAGGAGLNELTKRLGLSTASSPANRQSMLDQYRGQFSSNSSGMPGYTQIMGGNFNPEEAGNLGVQIGGDVAWVPNNINLDSYNNRVNLSSILNGGGFTSPSDTTSGLKRYYDAKGNSSQTDESGLNAYVDNLIAQQQSDAQNDPNYGSLLKKFGMSDYQEDPGYQFRLSEGQKALERKLNASGKTYSPEAAKALIGYNQDMGSQEYGSAYDRYNNDQSNIYNRLAGISGVGQQASQQLANQGAMFSNSASDILTGQGNAITAAAQAKSAGNQSMFNTLLGAGAQLGSAYMFSDENLKWDVSEPVAIERGHKIRTFRYKEDPSNTLYRGVIAQEVQEICPEAVKEIDGYLAVNYDLIGVKFGEVTDAA